jgi:hypothetical protein
LCLTASVLPDADSHTTAGVQVDPASESASDLAATPAPSRRRFNPSGWLDLQGRIQVLAVNHEQDGIVIALIALLTSYDHISLPAGASLQLPQQWGVWLNARLAAIESRLARFEREHLSSSNPLSSTGDSSPS